MNRNEICIIMQNVEFYTLNGHNYSLLIIIIKSYKILILIIPSNFLTNKNNATVRYSQEQIKIAGNGWYDKIHFTNHNLNIQ